MSEPPDLAFAACEAELHGHRVVYRTAGSGPPVVLIHGMVNSSRHWEKVALRLAEDHTVIAPDLIGHGDSAAPRGDYSLGAHAAGIRDLLASLGVRSASIVGHSLGGGVAMQFFYQFPHRTERLVLISSGGLGREVSPLLRAAAVPGASATPRWRGPAGGCARAASRPGSTSRRSRGRCDRSRRRARARRSCARCARSSTCAGSASTRSTASTCSTACRR
jgi:pimeloyl-ACP methyl ester carboxylesterase